MNYVIEVRQVAQSSHALISKGQKTLVFNSEEDARKFGKENIEGARYIASWEAITKELAKQRGHQIY